MHEKDLGFSLSLEEREKYFKSLVILKFSLLLSKPQSRILLDQKKNHEFITYSKFKFVSMGSTLYKDLFLYNVKQVVLEKNKPKLFIKLLK